MKTIMRKIGLILSICFYSATLFAQGLTNFDLDLVQIVAIGEATHGGHEEQNTKNRIIKDLLNSHAFRFLILEENMLVIKNMDSYVKGDLDGDIRDIIYPDYNLTWIYKTDEFIELLNWIRNYNTSHSPMVSIVGIDIPFLEKPHAQRDSLLFVNTQKYLDKNGSVKAILLAHNIHIANEMKSFKSLGWYLKDKYQERYFSIGQFFGKGSFYVFSKKDKEMVNSMVAYDNNTLSSKLSPTEKNTIMLTSEKKCLRKRQKFWMYGSVVDSIGSEKEYWLNPSKLFDAVVFHDSIHSSSNLMKNGNYQVGSKFVVQFDKVQPKGTSIQVNINYKTTSEIVVIETQFYNGNKYVTSVKDTLSQDSSSYSFFKMLPYGCNKMEIYVSLYADNTLTILGSNVIDQYSNVLLNNIFKEENVVNYPLLSNNLIRTQSFENGFFKIARQKNE